MNGFNGKLASEDICSSTSTSNSMSACSPARPLARPPSRRWYGLGQNQRCFSKVMA